MEKLFRDFLAYQLFVENLVSDKERKRFIQDLCEVAEISFIARLPRGFSKKALANYISKQAGRWDIEYKSQYLAERWKKILGGPFYQSTSNARRDLIKRDGEVCQYCSSRSSLEVHHVIPQDSKKFKGTNSYYNLVMACKSCNIEISNNIILPRNWYSLHSESQYK